MNDYIVKFHIGDKEFSYVLTECPDVSSIAGRFHELIHHVLVIDSIEKVN